MTAEEWFKRFDATKEKFHWFFEQYGFGIEWDDLQVYREAENRPEMYNIMNNVWFYLPDGKFNIMERPPGWMEFLELIEQ